MIIHRTRGWGAVLSLLVISIYPVAAQTTPVLERFDDVRLLVSKLNEGDTIRIELQREGTPEEHTLRLYFVDAPEVSADSATQRRRLTEQASHFGVSDNQLIIEFGLKARDRVIELLSEPFIVYTAFASAPGNAIYGMVTLSTGEDLALVLLRDGVARNLGVGRETYDGLTAAEYKEFLADYEAQGMEAKVGLWAGSDPEKIAD